VRAHTPTDDTAKTDRGPFEHLLTVAKRLGPDEMAVLELVAERLLLGRRRYGGLHLATDLAVYAAAGLLSEQRRRARP
jgi:hypothetical protein